MHEQIIDQLKNRRKSLKLTQYDIAPKMNTTASAIARFESGGGKKKHSPSLRTLVKYAEAVNCEIVFTIQDKEIA